MRRRAKSDSTRVRARRDRGAAIVEFAIVTPVLLVLLFAIIDFGTNYNNYNSLRHGVRESTRQGVIARSFGSTSCNIHGNPGNDQTKDLICLTKDRIGGDA